MIFLLSITYRGCSAPPTYRDENHSFSYEEEILEYAEDLPNVKRDGFVNTEELERTIDNDLDAVDQAIKEYIRPGAQVHLVGIGGVSMRPLGLVLQGMGLTVTGSDMNASVSTDELIAQGIHVAIGPRAENVEGAECIIRTAAAHNDNPEIAGARAAGIPVFERAQAWGVIMRAYENAICISGTHGKTTTSSMFRHSLSHGMNQAWHIYVI